MNKNFWLVNASSKNLIARVSRDPKKWAWYTSNTIVNSTDYSKGYITFDQSFKKFSVVYCLGHFQKLSVVESDGKKYSCYDFFKKRRWTVRLTFNVIFFCCRLSNIAFASSSFRIEKSSFTVSKKNNRIFIFYENWIFWWVNSFKDWCKKFETL